MGDAAVEREAAQIEQAVGLVEELEELSPVVAAGRIVAGRATRLVQVRRCVRATMADNAEGR